MGQISSYVPGSSGGGASAAAPGKSVPRRRGARRDFDRVSKAEDVPEYKGSLPVEELLAFVEGSAASPGAGRLPVDTKLRRTKRKEPMPGDGDIKLRNGDLKLVDVDMPVPHLTCVPHSEPLNGLLNGSSSKHSEKLVSGPPVNFDSYVDDHFSENEWISSEFASHLMENDDNSDGVLERKEKEFVLVQKKRRPKIAAAINGDTKCVKPLNGFCLSRNGIGNTMRDSKEECSYVNGFSAAEILETNGSGVSQNSGEDSSEQSFSSGIDDLSHFIGEDEHGGELYVDAPLSWNDAGDEDEDDDQEDSLSSFCSTMSSTESRQRLNSTSSPKIVSPDVDETNVLLHDGRQSLLCEGRPSDSISTGTSAEQCHSTDSCEILSLQQLKTDSSTVLMSSSDHPRRCTRLCCAMPYKHVKHQTAVVFCDSALDRTCEDVSSVVFSFGCTVSNHLVDGGLCIEAKSAAVSPDTESELNGIKQLCSESPDDGAAGPCDSAVSFMYSDSIPQRASASTQYVDLLQDCTRTCNGGAQSDSDSVDHFQVRDVQSYMYSSKPPRLCHSYN